LSVSTLSRWEGQFPEPEAESSGQQRDKRAPPNTKPEITQQHSKARENTQQVAKANQAEYRASHPQTSYL
jgi:hypothetical protein